MPKGRRTRDITVSKTVSLPMSLISAILDEGEIMNKDFSGTLVALANLGILYRRDQRRRDEEEAIKSMKEARPCP